MLIQFTITPQLKEALDFNHIDILKYKPAYNGESVGLDLFNAGEALVILPGETQLIPTGLKVALPPNTVGLILQRGKAIKTPLIHKAGVIDPGWTEASFVAALNHGNIPYEIPAFSKLPFQLVVMPCYTQFAYIDTDTYETTTRHAKRKDACIGSTDTQ